MSRTFVAIGKTIDWKKAGTQSPPSHSSLDGVNIKRF
jgi:hypothetical protein